MCEQSCGVEEKVYSGEVLIVELNSLEKQEKDISETSISLSAPLNLKVKCDSHPRRYSSLYILIALIAFLLLVPKYLKRKRT